MFFGQDRDGMPLGTKLDRTLNLATVVCVIPISTGKNTNN